MNATLPDELPNNTLEQRPHTEPLLRFTGTGGDLFWLALKNGLLCLITLGIYSFWGKTRRRQYVWSNSFLLGDPLEYTGTGGELFRSFVRVMVLALLVWTLLSVLLSFYSGFSSLLALLGVPLAHYASYQALRYRLTRTRWRGIRGNMGGSALGYTAIATAYSLLAVITCGIALPYIKSHLTAMRANAVYFGSRRFVFTGTSGPLYMAWLQSALICLVCNAIVWGVFGTLFFPFERSPLDEMDLWLNDILLLGILLTGILIFFSFLIYRAACLRWLAANMFYGNMRFFAPSVTARALLRLYSANLLILVCTVGIALPWVQARTIRFMQEALLYSGDPELESLLQDTRPVTVSGEGFLDALDVDMGF